MITDRRGLGQAIYTATTTITIVADREIDEDAPAKALKAKTTNGTGRNDKDGAATHGMPSFILMTRDGREIDGSATDGWPEGFNEHDGGEVVDLGDGEIVYKINYDNAYHLRYRLTQRSNLAREVVTEKYVLGMRILLLGYEHAMRCLRKGAEQYDAFSEFADEFRRMAARGAASTVLALAENLPKIVDASSLTAEDAD